MYSIDVDGNDSAPEWGICDHAGCTSPAQPFWLPDNAYPNDADGFYCEEHANSAGWCWMCGGFWGGVESFDFSKTGVCENCEPQYLHDCGERPDDDDVFGDEWDLT